MSKKQKQSGLGKALQNKLQRKRVVKIGDRAPVFYQQTEENQADKKKQKMQSVLEQNTLAQYLQAAQLSQQDFHANRNIKLNEIKKQVENKKIILLDNKQKKMIQEDKNILDGLQVPRRPHWQQAHSKEDLEKLENEAYLNWRRKLAEIEQNTENISITPYEKNIQVWRQLWRVVQRSQVLVQIIDGRNPLFFLSEDLFTYAKEVGKNKFLLLINKSDLIPQKIRQEWNQFFAKKGIDHCFFTAKQGLIAEGEEEIAKNTCTVLSPHQLVILLQQYSDQKSEKGIQIGLTGYPNVGKSSVINALLGRKKVGVASMPGKTKHFQTLKLTDKVTLCDCPGLVFPKVHASKAEMVLCGLYPIDTLKQYAEPLQIIAFRIPKHKIQQFYAIQWKQNQPYDGQSILVKYATLRGFFGGSGLPNQAQGAKYILKDYVNGQLVYNHRPPMQQSKELTFQQRQHQLEYEKLKFQKQQQKLQQNLDEQFFEKEQKEERTVQEIIENLSQEDFLDIIEGKKVEGLRITKELRKSLKFAIKRGDNDQQLKKILLEQASSGHKKLIKN